MLSSQIVWISTEMASCLEIEKCIVFIPVATESADAPGVRLKLRPALWFSILALSRGFAGLQPPPQVLAESLNVECLHMSSGFQSSAEEPVFTKYTPVLSVKDVSIHFFGTTYPTFMEFLKVLLFDLRTRLFPTL